MPVLAASNMPTSVTEIPRPPRKLPNSPLRVSSSSSAMRARSSVTPMNTNSGTATSVSLLMMPKMRFGSPSNRASLKLPPRTPNAAKIKAVPPSVKATGKPASNTTMTVRNSSAATHSMLATPQCAHGRRGDDEALQRNEDRHDQQHRFHQRHERIRQPAGFTRSFPQLPRIADEVR